MSTMADEVAKTMRMTPDELRAEGRLLKEVLRILEEGIQAMLRIYRSPNISMAEKKRRIMPIAKNTDERVVAIYPELGQPRRPRRVRLREP